MKQYFSVFALSARSTLFKLIGIIILMGIVQIGMFYFAMRNESYGILLENLMQDSFVHYAFVAGFAAYMSILMNMFGGKHPTRAAMTTSRLGIKESGVCWTMAVYNMCMLVVFLAAELAIILILCKMYLSSHLAGVYQHTVFIAFYRNGLMHGLLQMEDYWTYVENFIFIVSLGICASCTAKKQRRGKTDIAGAIASAFVAISFYNRTDYYHNFTFGLIVILFAAYAAYYISKGGTLDEDEDETAVPDLA